MAEATLKVATFLVPSVSVEFFESLQSYLEQKLSCHSILRYESRFESPRDIFNESTCCDIVFMTANGYLSMENVQGDTNGTSSQVGNKVKYDLLPLSCVTKNKSIGQDKPGVWLNVIVNQNYAEAKSFQELRGVRWARNVNDKLTEKKTLHHLWSMGESPLFFVNVLKTRSHLESIRFILQRKAQATAVDSNSLNMFLRENPDEKDQLHILESWGPLPPYAIAVRRSLPANVKQNIYKCLADMHTDPDGRSILTSFQLAKFAPNSQEDFYTATELIESTKKLTFDAAYY